MPTLSKLHQTNIKKNSLNMLDTLSLTHKALFMILPHMHIQLIIREETFSTKRTHGVNKLYSLSRRILSSLAFVRGASGGHVNVVLGGCV